MWVDGDYDESVRPSALNMRVGEPGVKVINVLQYLRDFDNDADAVIRAWSPYLKPQDIEDARAFYESSLIDKADIDAHMNAAAAPI